MTPNDDEPEFEWGEAHARGSDPSTSHQAANETAGQRAARCERMVAEAIGRMGAYGAICDDIVKLSGLDWNTASPRLSKLVDKNIITTRTDPNTFKPKQRIGRKRKPQQVYWLVHP
jgi:hypothetical protein